MNTCHPTHATGDKPQIVPVPGNNTRLIPEHVVRHGERYLNGAGEIVRHPFRMSMDEAQWSIVFHAESLAVASHPADCGHCSTGEAHEHAYTPLRPFAHCAD